MNADSPFHDAERMLQGRAGVRDRLERIGQRAIHDFVPEAYRRFFATLPMIFIGSADSDGRPWASVMTGKTGFVSTPDPGYIEIAGSINPDDPLAGNVDAGADIALLGIDLAAKRRVRAAGKVTAAGSNRFRIAVEQCFGNCPQYIHTRRLVETPAQDTERSGHARGRRLETLDAPSRRQIESADSFYIATRYGPGAAGHAHGADVSHKGGRPGFVRIVNDRCLRFPDYAGNNYFNTLGNLVVNPRAGLLFPDFETGGVLMLSGNARIVVDEPDPVAFPGVKHMVEFAMERGVVIDAAMPLRWRIVAWSPDVGHTGD